MLADLASHHSNKYKRGYWGASKLCAPLPPLRTTHFALRIISAQRIHVLYKRIFIFQEDDTFSKYAFDILRK